MATFSTDNLKDPAPLFCQYQGQFQPQRAFLEFNPETGECEFDWSGEIGGSVPANVWHGLIRRYAVPAAASRESLIEAAKNPEILGLLARVQAGFHTHWGGSNYSGVLNDDATDAEERLEFLLQGLEVANLWDIDEWLWESITRHKNDDGDVTSIEVQEIGTIKADTPAEILTAYAAEIQAAAEGDGVILDGDVFTYLENLQAEIDT